MQSQVNVQGGDWNMLVNMTGQRAGVSRTWSGSARSRSPAEENEFAKTIQKETGVEPKGLVGTLKAFDANPGPPEGGSTGRRGRELERS